MKAVFFIGLFNIHLNSIIIKHFRMNDFGFIIKSKIGIHHILHLR